MTKKYINKTSKMKRNGNPYRNSRRLKAREQEELISMFEYVENEDKKKLKKHG